jgi:thiol:disulfide interchange protein DsbD
MLRRIAYLFAVLLLAVSTATGQDILPATEYARWSAAAVPSQVKPGGHFELKVSVQIDDGWKMYALDSPSPSYGVRFEFGEVPAGFRVAGAIKQSEPREVVDPFFNATVRYFSREAGFSVPIAVESFADLGKHTLGGSARFQICNDRLCLPPTPVSFTGDVVLSESPPEFTGGAAGIELGSASEDFPAAGDVSAEVTDLDAARSSGFVGFLILAIGAGLAALLTPCVFPMIPLTVSYFTKHAGTRKESIRMAIVYGASIIVTFTSLGVIAAIFVGASGAQSVAANPWINLFIGLIFVVFALSLLGLFELRLPNGLLNYFNRQSTERHGYLGVLFMGLTLTLVSFSCTAPFVGGLLAATVNDEWAYPVVGMLAFSATFSVPFIVFALFPKALTSLPRSGAWMNTVKVVLGFVELAAALKFLSNADLIWGWGLISRPIAIAAAVVIFALTGFYLLGKLRLSHEPQVESIGVGRLLFAVGFLGISLYMLPGLFGAPLNALDAYLPPRLATDVSLVSTFGREGKSDDLTWHMEIDEAFILAREADKPLLIDFTGYTCTNCRQMEENVFPRQAVATRLESGFVLLRLYTDDQEEGPDLQRYQLRMTGTVALPTYAIVDARENKLIGRKTGLASADEFAAFLDRGTSIYREESLALR